MALYDMGLGGGSPKLPYKVFHADHGVSTKHIEDLALLSVPHRGFFLRTLRLPVGFDDLMSGLWGPAAGDPPVPDSEVQMKVRNNRPGPSRMVARPHRSTRLMTMIGIRDDNGVTFFTIYGGPAAPREPWDPSMNDAERAESREFWSKHALAL